MLWVLACQKGVTTAYSERITELLLDRFQKGIALFLVAYEGVDIAHNSNTNGQYTHNYSTDKSYLPIPLPISLSPTELTENS